MIAPRPPLANSRQIAATTAGIARNMQNPLFAPMTRGGGDLNGSANVAHLMYQAGTNATRWQMPRTVAGNCCGIV